jgi:hypothetical protein
LTSSATCVCPSGVPGVQKRTTPVFQFGGSAAGRMPPRARTRSSADTSRGVTFSGRQGTSRPEVRPSPARAECPWNWRRPRPRCPSVAAC